VEKVSVIIPAYNEESRIETTLRRYWKHFNANYQNFEILVLTDGCSDRTPEIVEEISKDCHSIRCLNPPCRLGKGGAVIKGIRAASGDVVGFLDADGAIPPEDVCSLLASLDGRDGVIASRRAKGAKILRQEPPARVLASRGFNMLVRILFGMPFKDTQCGGKIFKANALRSVVNEIGLTDWSFDVELLYNLNKKGYRIEEVPVSWEHKDGSKIDLLDTSVKMLVSVVGLRVKCSRMSQYIPTSIIDVIYRNIGFNKSQ
jgi:glycosyltransferase involved in cell wall biosynthesis